jgi:hypothetical protein
MSVNEISTQDCNFNKDKKTLSIPRRIAYQGDYWFPREVIVHSHHTGKKVLFRQISADHPDFDEDGWDGEQAAYEPIGEQTNVRLLFIYNDI